MKITHIHTHTRQNRHTHVHKKIYRERKIMLTVISFICFIISPMICMCLVTAKLISRRGYWTTNEGTRLTIYHYTVDLKLPDSGGYVGFWKLFREN